MFRGVAIESDADRDRLAGQLERVKDLMRDGQWRNLGTISAAVHGSEAGVSARLRDLRKTQFGAYVVERRRVGNGLFEYRVLPAIPSAQGALFAPPSHVPERVR